MPADQATYNDLLTELGPCVRLVAVSKTKPAEDIRELYGLGQRDFGENYVQELTEKQALLPGDIRWHFLGHLQSNKVKYIAPFVHLIHGVDSLKLLKEIDKQAFRSDRVIDCLLQAHIATEETKFGFDETELDALMNGGRAELGTLKNIRIAGLMGMASFTDDPAKIRSEFHGLASIFNRYFKDAHAAPNTPPEAPGAQPAPAGSSPRTTPINSPAPAPILSMGMSGDYQIAIAEGSNMVRIGSLLFGARPARIG
ncbi:MAG TPA: YggS family pyridoxal phosphate-dependent enzyme [Puia sp.]|nr:YggS family pyridoxal phosphate-dependent enzyme [Puia sp.]